MAASCRVLVCENAVSKAVNTSERSEVCGISGETGLSKWPVLTIAKISQHRVLFTEAAAV